MRKIAAAITALALATIIASIPPAKRYLAERPHRQLIASFKQTKSAQEYNSLLEGFVLSDSYRNYFSSDPLEMYAKYHAKNTQTTLDGAYKGSLKIYELLRQIPPTPTAQPENEKGHELIDILEAKRTELNP